MALIKLSYDVVMEQASEIEKAASLCKNMTDEISKQAPVIYESWSGDFAEIYLQKIKDMHHKYNDIYEVLNKCATELRTVAKNIKDVDEKE